MRTKARKPRSNNTNKLSPQELTHRIGTKIIVQIIQINLVLKNPLACVFPRLSVQIIQINLVLKNYDEDYKQRNTFK